MVQISLKPLTLEDFSKNQSVKVFENTELPLPVPVFTQTLKLSVNEIFNWLKI